MHVVVHGTFPPQWWVDSMDACKGKEKLLIHNRITYSLSLNFTLLQLKKKGSSKLKSQTNAYNYG